MRSGADLARELLAKADNDLTTAVIGIEHGAPRDTVCFHLQQAAEKFLKSLLTALEIEYPRTHDLGLLLELVVASAPALARFADAFDTFVPYAVEIRYSASFCPTEPEVQEALSVVREVRSAVAAALPPGIRPVD
jgi:HEPN domain-containing protein